ncbi:hypothetical protein HDU67_000862, partial [Dinochytrium kinnereticum]
MAYINNNERIPKISLATLRDPTKARTWFSRSISVLDGQAAKEFKFNTIPMSLHLTTDLTPPKDTEKEELKIFKMEQLFINSFFAENLQDDSYNIYVSHAKAPTNGTPRAGWLQLLKLAKLDSDNITSALRAEIHQLNQTNPPLSLHDYLTKAQALATSISTHPSSKVTLEDVAYGFIKGLDPTLHNSQFATIRDKNLETDWPATYDYFSALAPTHDQAQTSLQKAFAALTLAQNAPNRRPNPNPPSPPTPKTLPPVNHLTTPTCTTCGSYRHPTPNCMFCQSCRYWGHVSKHCNPQNIERGKRHQGQPQPLDNNPTKPDAHTKLAFTATNPPPPNPHPPTDNPPTDNFPNAYLFLSAHNPSSDIMQPTNTDHIEHLYNSSHIPPNPDKTQTTEWHVDSGSTLHVTSNIDNLQHPTYHRPRTFQGAFGQNHQSSGIRGTVHCSPTDILPNSPDSFKLTDVEYVPNANANLMSVSTICDRDCTAVFTKHGVHIYPPSTAPLINPSITPLLYGPRKNNLYTVTTTSPTPPPSDPPTPPASLLLSSNPDPRPHIERWHCRFNHLNYDDL